MKKKQIVGAALAVGLTTVAGANAAIHVPNINTDASIFGMEEVSSPSVLAMSNNSGQEHKCGENKCGESKCGEDHSCGGDHKCGEGKCGH